MRPDHFGGMASTGSPGMEWRYRKKLSVAPRTVSPLDKVGRPKAGSEHRGETRSTRSFTARRNNGIRFRESFNCCRAPRSEIAEQPEGCGVLPCPPVGYFAILRITRCRRGGARVKDYLCRPTSGPKAVTEWAWRPLCQTRLVPVYCSVGWRPEPAAAESGPPKA